MDIYADNILDHYKNPRHSGKLDDSDVWHEEKNLSCGDALSIDLNIKDEKISDLAWTGTGCAISQASMSILSEELIGKTIDEIQAMKPQDIYERLGVPIGPRRFKCALLCLHTLKNAMNKYQEKPMQSWIGTVAVDDDI